MQYEWITGAIMILAVAFLVAGAFVLLRKRWFLAWLRGSFGLALVGVAIFCALVALNFYSFKRVQQEMPVATVSFERLGPQHYRAVVSKADSNNEQTFELKGDLWQIDARIIKWHGFWTSIGLEPGYKLDRIQGRFLSLEQERSEERTVYALNAQEEWGFDLWAFLNNQRNSLAGIDASYGSATYVPMADGGIFSVALTDSGLLARPINERAEIALEAWN